MNEAETRVGHSAPAFAASGWDVAYGRRLRLPEETGTTPKATPKTTPEKPSKTTLKTEARILALLRKHPEASRTELARLLGGISTDGVKYHLEQLKKAGRIRHIGPNRGGHWEVLE
jgi:ATP-dependent DNA helicase RecG